jgi:hypothetical protein
MIRMLRPTPARLIGDTVYGTAPMLAWMVDEKDIAPHVPVWDRTERKDGSFSRSDFRWDDQANEYRCPADKTLRCDRRNFTVPRTGITKADTIKYRASQLDCDACPPKARCCPKTPTRTITRSIHEDAASLRQDALHR